MEQAPAILRLPAVIAMTGLARTTIYKWIGTGEFPTPVRLGPRAVGFYKTEVEEFLTSRRRGLRRDAMRYAHAGREAKRAERKASRNAEPSLPDVA